MIHSPPPWYSFDLFLENCPRKYLGQLHAKITGQKGLVQSKEMIEQLNLHHTQNSPNKSQFSAEDAACIEALYLRGAYGISESGFSRLLPHLNPSQIQEKIRGWEGQQLLYARKGLTFFGFRDLLDKWAPQGNPPPTPVEKISFQDFLIKHLMVFLAMVKNQQVKLTQKGELHRKFLVDYFHSCHYINHLIKSARVPELEFILNYCTENKLIVPSQGQYTLTETGHLITGLTWSELEHKILDWWGEKRFPGAHQLIRWIHSQPHHHFELEPFEYWLIPFQKTPFSVGENHKEKKGKGSWEGCSPLLQEMWLLGLLDFSISQGKITGILTRGPYGSDLKTYVTGDFMMYLPIPTRPRYLFLAAALCLSVKDDRISQYRITRESLLLGIENGLDPQECWEFFLAQGDGPVLNSVKEWLESVTQIEIFNQTTLLKIKDSTLLQELENWSEFQSYVWEKIPQYGYRILPQHENTIRELLSRLNYFPQKHSIPNIPSPLPDMGTEAPFTRPGELDESEEVGEVTIYHWGPEIRTLPNTSAKAVKSEIQTELEIKRILELAILTEKMIEVCLHDSTKEKKWYRPIHLLKNTAVPKLIATDVQSGQRWETQLEKIFRVKLLD